VGKPKRSSGGFSAAKPSAAAPKQQITKSSADHAAKEQQAVALINQGKLQEAEAIYRDLIAAGTRNHIVYGNLAAICGMQGRFDELIDLLNKALKLEPNDPDAHYNLGIALQEKGDLDAAITSYNTALGLKPNDPEAHYNLGIALKEKGDLDVAIASFNTALQFKPNYPEAHNNLGIALQEKGDLTAAIASYNTALELKPSYPEAHCNLGIALKEKGDLTAAIASYNTALQLKPNDPEAHCNLGIALKEKGDFTDAIASYNTALELKPNYPEALKNLSTTELLAGDYKSGWLRYEYRFQCTEDILYANPPCQVWKDSGITEDKQLLLVSEQGLGDTLQFMRYAIALRDKGVSVSFCAQPKLHTLIQVSGIDQSPLTPEQANAVTEGFWIPLLSIPRHLEVSPENPIITEPYIKTTDELSAKWQKIVSAEKRPIIGINWQGNPGYEKRNHIGRSLPLNTFAPIAQSTDASLLSLQKGFGSEQLETCSFKDRFISCQDQVNDTWDYLETAAIVANCDLVITSDTSVAHLAGGMGKTTWLLLHKVPDWRWGLEGETTFWYPSMRLFRQKERGNWDEVLERVAEALLEQFPEIAAASSASTQPRQVATEQTGPIAPKPLPQIQASISLGELIDKITILQIKAEQLQGTALENAKKELAALESTLNNLHLNIDTTLIQRLKEVNQDLWQIEDDIRDQERQKSFGENFIHLARSVYQRNDRRAAIKKEINTTYGSAFVEEKSYQDY
jgi:Flp pilus assembly protein TadD